MAQEHPVVSAPWAKWIVVAIYRTAFFSSFLSPKRRRKTPLFFNANMYNVRTCMKAFHFLLQWKLCSSRGETNADARSPSFFFQTAVAEGLEGQVGMIRGGRRGGGVCLRSACGQEKRINSIITKDYVHLGQGPPFSHRALTVKSLFCAPLATRGTLKKVIMFPRCGAKGPPSLSIL